MSLLLFHRQLDQVFYEHSWNTWFFSDTKNYCVVLVFVFFFPTENPGKETHVLEIRNCQLICKLTGHCYKCLPHICPNQPKWQYWKAPIWLQYVALSLPACGDSQLVTPQVIFSSPLHFELLPETSVLTVPEKHKTPFSK